MSRVEIYVIKTKDKRITYNGGGDVHNAWLGCMHIWESLEKKYLPSMPPFPWESKEEKENAEKYRSRICMMHYEENNPMREIWNLVIHPDLTWDERIVLQTTFDRGYIAYDDIPEVASAYENVDFANDNMKKQAEIFRKIYEDGKDGSVFGIFKNENSVCCASDFCRYDEDTGEMFLDDDKNWDYMADLRELRDNGYKFSDE